MPDFPLFPGVPDPLSRTIATVAGDGWFERVLTIDEHTGTHIDAPAHFAAGGLTVDQIPAGNLVAALVVIRITDRATRDHDVCVSSDDLLAWERAYGRIPNNALVVMDSGWASRVSTPGAFLNADSTGVLHYPGFAPEAAAFLIQERDVVGLGVDTLSLDHGPALDFPVHHIALPAGKYGVEAIANLEDVPPAGATVIVGAPPYAGGSGAPVRVLAIL